MKKFLIVLFFSWLFVSCSFDEDVQIKETKEKFSIRISNETTEDLRIIIGKTDLAVVNSGSTSAYSTIFFYVDEGEPKITKKGVFISESTINPIYRGDLVFVTNRSYTLRIVFDFYSNQHTFFIEEN